MRAKIGLALGSGGAKGLAHIGVLKVLEENNIPIDYIAGSSIGAFIGAYYALNKEIKPLEEIYRKMKKKDILKLVDLSPPTKGIIKGRKIRSFIKSIIGNKRFEDVQIPLAIVTTNLCSGEEVVMREGKLVDAIMASISIPGIFPPQKIKGKYYVDGGIVNPTPVNIVKEMGADVIVGVDLTMKKEVKFNKTPTLFEVLWRSYEIIRKRIVESNVMGENTLIIQPVDPYKPSVLSIYKFTQKEYIDYGAKEMEKNLSKLMEMIKGSNT